ncbi:MAG: hypothetical protein ACRCTI_07420, partial [Beijerinckiaceae bacterium]
MSKYDTPEWRKSPIRAQLREALNEIEHLRAALQNLDRRAALLDRMHSGSVAHRSVALAARLVGLNAGEQANRAASLNMATAGWAQAVSELVKIEGWMKSLNESEIGLFAMLAPDAHAPEIVAEKRAM